MTNTVLIFDSGVGGLSILKEIHQQLPQLNLNYLMDNAAFPYGTKSDEFLTKRVIEVCSKAVAELAPDILVVACNTASTLALPQLRAALKIPVVGVVPAIKTAANLSTTKVIGLIATPATVCRPYTDNLVAEFSPNCEVHRLGSTELVLWAEKHINQGAIPNRQALKQHIQPWLNNAEGISHVVLGCTHFPLLLDSLQSLWPSITWVDSGNAIAMRVASLLNQRSNQTLNLPNGRLSLYWTAQEGPALGVARFLGLLGELTEQRSVNIPHQLAD